MARITDYSDIYRRDKLTEKFEEIDKTVQIAEVTLTAANILAMYATPVEVIAAPGAGKVIEVLSCLFALDKGSTAFADGGAVNLEYETATTVPLATLAANVVNNDDDIVSLMPSVATSYEVGVNEAIMITNATGAFTTGNGTLKLKIAYRVHETGL